MKHLLNTLSCLAVMVFVIGVVEASAQHTYKFRDSLGTYTVKFVPNSTDTRFKISPTKPLVPDTHELRLGLAWGAANSYGVNINWNESMSFYGSKWEQGLYCLSNDHYYTFNLDYGYWTNEWLCVGANATWVMGLCNVYNVTNYKRVHTLRHDFVTVMPTARFAWLRRGIVQMYSSLGFGLGIERSDRYSGYNKTSCYCAFDFKFVGLSVGRKWFGFIEAGYGSRGIVNAGFGCRINSKTK